MSPEEIKEKLTYESNFAFMDNDADKRQRKTEVIKNYKSYEKYRKIHQANRKSE